MDTGTVVILVLQVVLGVGLVPIGRWVFIANSRLGVIEAATASTASRLDAANGDGIPTVCKLHSERLHRHSVALANLQRASEGKVFDG